MIPKWFIWVIVFVCSIIGSYVPLFWGGSVFSFASVFLGGIGAIIGVFVAVKIGKLIG